MENWIATLLVEYGWHIVIGVLGLLAGFMISFLLHRPQFKAAREERAELRRELEAMREQPTEERADARADDPVVNYIEALGIVRAYIAPALQDMPERARFGIDHQFVKAFGKTTGAMLGEGRYNRERLRQWIESNAARFLVNHRDDMR